MNRLRRCASLLILAGFLPTQSLQTKQADSESLDLGMLAAIRAEELNHSRGMDHLRTETIPRKAFVPESPETTSSK
jgi:hypothetical protein